MAKSFVYFLGKICGIKWVGRIQNGDLMRSELVKRYELEHIIRAIGAIIQIKNLKSKMQVIQSVQPSKFYEFVTSLIL